MSTVDHAAESKKIAGWLGESVIADEGITDATIIATAIDAHRHAVLAVAEQLRVANLIALASWMGESDPEGMDLLRAEAVNALAPWVPHGMDDEHPEIHPDIARLLGIGGTDE